MKHILIGLALVIMLGALMLWGWSGKWSGLLEDSPPETRVLLGVPGCHPVQQTCQAQGAGGDVGLYLQPPVRPLQAFELVVSNGLPTEADAVEVEFRMPGMMMGLNRFRLQRTKGTSRRWQGTAMLPVCVSGRSDWLAEVSLQQGEQRVVAQYSFVLEAVSK